MPTHNNRRNINGLLLLDKPQNITSNHALQECKRLFNAHKAGHGGSLDPIADGALPILFGYYTRLAGYFLLSSKVYEGEFVLGARTTTGDKEGDIVEQAPLPELTTTKIEDCLEKFRGPIMQQPPQYSAIKFQGKPSYKYARQGKQVPLAPRQVHIYSLELLDFSANSLQLRIECSKGTYIRSLAEDIGKALGSAAYVNRLRRTQVAKLHDMVTMEQLRQAAMDGTIDDYLIQDINLLTGLEKIHVSPHQAKRFCYGDTIDYAEQVKEGEVCVLLQVDKEQATLLGLGKINQGKLHPRHIFVRTH